MIDSYLSGTKFEWMMRHGGVPRTAAFGTIDAWLLFKLTGVHATDYSNASRTMLFDLHRTAWDEELCDLLGVPISSLPESRPNARPEATLMRRRVVVFR